MESFLEPYQPKLAQNFLNLLNTEEFLDFGIKQIYFGENLNVSKPEDMGKKEKQFEFILDGNHKDHWHIELKP